MSDILEKIAAYKRIEIAEAKSRISLDDMRRQSENASVPRGFVKAIRNKHADGKAALIAEVKKASPSKGLIREDFNPPELALAYANGGAACLSVLTDTPSFQGSPDYLMAARDACSLPVLRKDFMFEPYQVYEARSWGADCILIIMSAVTDAEAMALEETAFDCGMDVLIEIHNKAELDRALTLKSDLIGINNRDLKSFKTTLKPTEELAPQIPPERIVVSESGIGSSADIAALSKFNVNTFLVGESLMRQQDVEAATRTLLDA